MSLEVFDGRPVVVYSVFNYDEGRYLYYAIASSPDGIGEWNQRQMLKYGMAAGPMLPGENEFGQHSLISLNGYPALITYDIDLSGGGGGHLCGWMRFYLAETQDGLGSWQEGTVLHGLSDEEGSLYSALRLINGKPAAAFHKFDIDDAQGLDDNALAYFTTDSADSLGEWQMKSIVDTCSNAGYGRISLLQLANGKVAVVYTRRVLTNPSNEQRELVIAVWNG